MRGSGRRRDEREMSRGRNRSFKERKENVSRGVSGWQAGTRGVIVECNRGRKRELQDANHCLLGSCRNWRRDIGAVSGGRGGSHDASIKVAERIEEGGEGGIRAVIGKSKAGVWIGT